MIVPAFNESASIVATLKAMCDFLDQQPWTWEIIVSADGADGTRERAAQFAASHRALAMSEGVQEPIQGPIQGPITVIGSPRRRGKGHGVREGARRARGDIIGFLDADYKTPIEEIHKILPWFNGGFDVVIGSRRAGESRIEVPQPFYRRAGSRVFGLLVGAMMGLPPVRDTQCGFKFFTRAAATKLFTLQRTDGYMFDVEILRLCAMLKLRVREVGVAWRDDGDSRYDPVRGTLKNLGELWRIRRMQYDGDQDVAA